MKLSKKTLSKRFDLLEEYNFRQDKTNRDESIEVKRCFTTQFHQTIIASTAIMAAVISIMGKEPDWLFLAITSALLIALCLMTIDVGCHKFNTANRATAYQIHLSRITDYEESSRKKSKIALELRRIDWEEAMFAWRIIQPIIFDFFYRKNKRKYEDGVKKELVKKEIKRYPWNDTKKLIKSGIKDEKGDIEGKFYPGTYLRKMMFIMNFVVVLILIIYARSIQHLLDLNELYSLKNFGVLSFTLITLGYIIYQVVHCHKRCTRLESGLNSIQTSAFVWRIVCITMLLARLESIKKNRKTAAKDQIYKGYTIELAKIASTDLYFKLHIIHEWLEEKETDIIKMIKNLL